MVHNFDVLGLRATASHDIVVEGAFVPEHRAQRTNDHSDAGCLGRATNPGWLYKIPFTQVFQRAVSSACLGALDGAIAEFRSRAAAHVGKHGAKDRRGRERPAGRERGDDDQRPAQAGAVPQLRPHRRLRPAPATGCRWRNALMQRAQAAQVPKQCAERVSELMRACAANGRPTRATRSSASSVTCTRPGATLPTTPTPTRAFTAP
jgi:3-hydroxy-9,10-secoandrosta-1,3,5(10)-triene-9,17-dione monooxygenase